MAELRRIAAIDVGTNSVHMVVADVDAGGFTVVATEKEVVRLGEGSDGMDHISPAALRRGVAAIVLMSHIADGLGARVRAVATSAVREASNKEEFLAAVLDATGVEVEVISGAEEARLIHLGVSRSLDLREDTALVVDIGGGSTEFCLARRGVLEIAQSIKVGAVRLTDWAMPEGAISKAAVSAVRERVRSAITHVVREIIAAQPGRIVLSSGTSESVARMVAVRRALPVPTGLNGFKFTAREIDDVADEILAVPSTKQRARLEGLDPKRADIIPAGIIILQEVVGALGATRLEYCDSALREGVLIDAASRSGLAGGVSVDSATDSVRRLARRCSVDMDNAEHVANLAEQIYVAIEPSSGGLVRLLRAAAILAECGKAVAFSRYHVHSHYIISHADLAGFTDAEIEIIALTARFHRKSPPRESHELLSRLSDQARHEVELLAAILRLATALNRTHDRSIESVGAVMGKKGLELQIVQARHASSGIDINVRAARERSEPLAAALGSGVRILGPERE